GSSYPLQRLVVTAFGNRLAWSDTLDGALDELFGGDSGASAGDEGTGSETPQEPTPPGEGEEPTEPGEPVEGDLARAIADIQQAYEDGQAALREGDWEAYAEAQERLEAAIQGAGEAAPDGGSTEIDAPPPRVP